MTSVPRFSRRRSWPGATRYALVDEPDPPAREPLPQSPAEIDRRRVAFMVVARLAFPGLRIAVIVDKGRAALVSCREQLFDVLAQDHLIVGVYTFGATVRDVIEDLEAAGL